MYGKAGPLRAVGEAPLPCPQGAYILLGRCNSEEKQLVKQHDIKKGKIALLYEILDIWENALKFQEVGRLSRVM